ncbi:Hypothetical_protein [Hexamita inflata]|uniref:Hypothetical_protein n=1 Tax=Hexamita inflata TaxID=28002 RepID=A0ABP1HUF4_9EUKA
MINLFHYLIATCPTQITDQQLSVDASTTYNFSTCFPNNLINKSFVSNGIRTSQLFENATQLVKIINTTFINFGYSSDAFLFANIALLQLKNVSFLLNYVGTTNTNGIIAKGTSVDVYLMNLNISVDKVVNITLFGTTKYLQLSDSRIFVSFQTNAQFDSIAQSSQFTGLSNVEINFNLTIAQGQILSIASATQVTANNILIKFSSTIIGNQAALCALCAPFDNCYVVYNLTQADTFAVEYFNKTQKITDTEFILQASSFLYKYTSTSDDQYFVQTANFARKQLDETNTAVYVGYCANLTSCWCTGKSSQSSFCNCLPSDLLFKSKCLTQYKQNDGTIYVQDADSTKYYLACPSSKVLNPSVYKCYTQCDSSCSNTITSSSIADCICICPLTIVKDNKCSTECKDNKYYVSENNQITCYEKCSNCVGGDAYLKGKTVVYYRCDSNKYKMNEKQEICEKTEEDKNKFIIGISVGSGALMLIAVIILGVKGCLQTKKDKQQRV